MKNVQLKKESNEEIRIEELKDALEILTNSSINNVEELKDAFRIFSDSFSLDLDNETYGHLLKRFLESVFPHYKERQPVPPDEKESSPLESESKIEKLTLAEFQEDVENEKNIDNLYNAYKVVEKVKKQLNNKIKEALDISEEGSISIYPALDIKKLKNSKTEEEPQYKVFGYLRATVKNQNRNIRPLTPQETEQAIKEREHKEETFANRYKKSIPKMRTI